MSRSVIDTSIDDYRTVSVPEAAALLGISAINVRLMVKSGQLRSFKVGTHPRIPLEQLRALVSGSAAD